MNELQKFKDKIHAPLGDTKPLVAEQALNELKELRTIQAKLKEELEKNDKTIEEMINQASGKQKGKYKKLVEKVFTFIKSQMPKIQTDPKKDLNIDKYILLKEPGYEKIWRDYFDLTAQINSDEENLKRGEFFIEKFQSIFNSSPLVLETLKSIHDQYKVADDAEKSKMNRKFYDYLNSALKAKYEMVTKSTFTRR